MTTNPSSPMTRSTRPNRTSTTSSLLAIVAGAGQVGVDAPIAGAVGKDRFESTGDLAMVDTRAVQGENRQATAELGVVDVVIHPASVETTGDKTCYCAGTRF